MAYKLQLPEQVGIHPVFHISQLKRHLGAKVLPLAGLSMVAQGGKIKTEPVKILSRRIIPRNGDVVGQWLVHWNGMTKSEVTWEDVKFIMASFPDCKP